MNTTEAFVGLSCVACDASFDADTTAGRCPECGGILDPDYDYDRPTVDRATFAERPRGSLWRYEELLPFPRSAAVSMDEGGTPLVDCPALADRLGVARVLVKDEGRNPTGSHTDREASLAVTAADQHDATDVALASTGDGGQSVSAYAARADLTSHVFVPARANFVNKAMINVHGGDMNVVGGRLDDAEAAFADAVADEENDWYSLQSFETPYRHEGAKTTYLETVEALDWTVPDHVVCPTGRGATLVGLAKGARAARDIGLVDERPAFWAAQAAGCAPIVDAFEAGADHHEPVEYPDTICGGVEVGDPSAGSWVLDVLRETDGGAVATPDDEVLESAVAVAQQAGLEMGATAGVAASGAWDLAERDAFDPDDTVVLVNTAAGNKEDDVLRSHLMGQGI